MTSLRPYWCPNTMERRPCWCPKPILWELSFVMQTLSFVPINLYRCWSRAWKHSPSLQLLRKRLSKKNVYAPIPKGNMGCNQYTVRNDRSCRSYFCCFPLALANICPWPPVQFTQNHPLNLSGLSRVLFQTTFLEIAVCGKCNNFTVGLYVS